MMENGPVSKDLTFTASNITTDGSCLSGGSFADMTPATAFVGQHPVQHDGNEPNLASMTRPSMTIAQCDVGILSQDGIPAVNECMLHNGHWMALAMYIKSPLVMVLLVLSV